ncbi:MAG: FAD:protein FMN transferase, partial [Gemmatimonas sp.]
DRGHHLVDPRTGDAAIQMQSATVVAPQAAIADALATAVFVLGVERGAALLREQQVDGLLIDAHGALTMVHGWGASEWQLPSEVAWS